MNAEQILKGDAGRIVVAGAMTKMMKESNLMMKMRKGGG